MAFFEAKVSVNEKQNTFILMWNPSISSYTMARFEEDLEYLSDVGSIEDFDWDVWEYEKAKEGDKFYLIKVGPGVNGVVMAGTFTSEPYKSEDWSGKGRERYYMQIDIDIMIHPDKCHLLTSELLAREIPDFTWDKGHSGLMLNDEQAKKMDELWNIYLEQHADIFKPRAYRYND